MKDNSFLLFFNASEKTLSFTVPNEIYGEGWQILLDTSDDAIGTAALGEDIAIVLPGVEVEVADRSIVVLRKASEPSA